MAQLTESELLMLNQLVYFSTEDQEQPWLTEKEKIAANKTFLFTEGKSVREIVDEISQNKLKDNAPLPDDEINTFLDQVRNHPNLLDYKVGRNPLNRGVDASVSPIVIFQCDDNKDAVVTFAGTTGYQQWYDDFISGADNPKGSAYQRKHKQYFEDQMEKYVRELKEDKGYNITVTGHSKGGNQAQYMQLLHGDLFDECVAFDGEGFSEAFCEAHKNEIAANKDKITVISSNGDLVNALLRTVAGKRKYIQCEINGTNLRCMFHNCNAMLYGEDGSMRPEVDGASPVQQYVNGLSIHLQSIQDPELRKRAYQLLGRIAAEFFQEQPEIYKKESPEEIPIGKETDSMYLLSKILDILSQVNNLENAEELGIVLAYTLEYTHMSIREYLQEFLHLEEPALSLLEGIFGKLLDLHDPQIMGLFFKKVEQWARENHIATWSDLIAEFLKNPWTLIKFVTYLLADGELDQNLIYVILQSIQENFIEKLNGLMIGAKDFFSDALVVIQTCLEMIRALGNKAYDLAQGIKQAAEEIMQKVSQCFSNLVETIKKGMESFFEKFVSTIGEKMRSFFDKHFNVYLPELYRMVSGLFHQAQGPVSVNLKKLAECIYLLHKAAEKVEEIDQRLDYLYTGLTKVTPEDGSNVLTPVTNTYNLYSADFKIDQGKKLRKQANQLQELYDSLIKTEYDINEKAAQFAQVSIKG